MKLFFRTKPVLDEREMQEMYRIDHLGFWAMYALLCAAVVIQLIMGADFVQMGGEVAVICAVSAGMLAAYAKRGIWDENARPSLRGNAAYSAVSAVGVALVTLGVNKSPVRAVVTGAVTFLLCFLLLMLLMRYIQRRQEAQSEAFEEE